MAIYEIIACKVTRGMCPQCESGNAYLTYEENRIYRLACKCCGYKKEREYWSWYEATDGFFGKPFTERQERKMLHALGLDYTDKPHRNYYEARNDDSDWSKLVRLGFAERKYKYSGLEYDLNHFVVTKIGREFLDIQLKLRNSKKTAWN